MSHAAATLMRAARPMVVAGTLGLLLLVLAALSAVPAIVSLVLGDTGLEWRLFGVAALELLLGTLLVRLPRPDDIQWNEALAVTGLAFLLAAGAMVWPLMGNEIGALDAWFEAVSGVTTTGLTTLRDMAERPAGFLFLRAWMQWYGGLGIAVLTVALIMRHHASGRRLLETTGESLTHASARDHARRVLLVYLGLTGLAVFGVWMSGLAPFQALLHGLAAVATGGFAASDRNIAPLPPVSVAVLSAICLAAAVSLPLYAQLWRKGPRALLGEPDVRALIASAVVTAALLALIGVTLDGVAWPRALADGLVQSISAQTDTGFSTVDIAALPAASQLVLIVSMTIGGCTGSTAGGIKLIRLLILIRLVQLALRRTAVSERAVLGANVGTARIEPDAVAAALQLLGLWALVLILSWFVFLLHGVAPLASLFEVASATANAGLSAGLTGPDLAPLLKVVLSVDMLLGRVEILALLVLLYYPTWFGRRRAS
ncbi:Trk-type K+ transport system, membrane component [Thioflavicoccus mobilis 8321]|uniref:Trk-type K+ transport system, membrane component n=1 Tax=Thioflavicoccus mobilis 8321 TaxID=765912 RepID=L0GWG9_9GAMM|nr:potassium transporter TrkG [Thioflavicoccus mobilis]AGA90331.1 Trk-type K+ transport system, membrane component [Thioflavicoccus mobilis 8321]